jgi:hypothetical protein
MLDGCRIPDVAGVLCWLAPEPMWARPGFETKCCAVGLQSGQEKDRLYVLNILTSLILRKTTLPESGM